MVGIKDSEMPSGCKSCDYCSFTHNDEPFCDLTYEYIWQFDKRQNECPLEEAIPKDNVYKAIQEIMKYEHEGLINISLARLDEILKKCKVSGVEDEDDI